MSYNNHDDGNPFYTDLPQQSPTPSPQQPTYNNSNSINNQQNNNVNSQPQAIFTNTNVNFDDYSAPKQQPQYQPNLQFQSFNHPSDQGYSNINNGVGNNSNNNNNVNKIGGGINNGNGFNNNGGVPESDFSESASLNNNTNQSGGSVEDKKYSFWQVPYYRFLFNVDTVEVGHRLLRSMMPIKFSFFNLIKENPDLYGPFWVLTSLVFIIAISANLNDYFNSDHSVWKANMNIVVYSAIAIYGYSILIPIVLWGIFKWMKLGLRLLDMLCIYGYALFIYIPISVLCVIPIGMVQWIVVGVGALLSGAFLVTNIFTPLKEGAVAKRGLIICAVIGVLHLGLALVLRLYFFANHTSSITNSSEAPTTTPSVTPTPTVTPSVTPSTTTA